MCGVSHRSMLSWAPMPHIMIFNRAEPPAPALCARAAAASARAAAAAAATGHGVRPAVAQCALPGKTPPFLGLLPPFPQPCQVRHAVRPMAAAKEMTATCSSQRDDSHRVPPQPVGHHAAPAVPAPSYNSQPAAREQWPWSGSAQRPHEPPAAQLLPAPAAQLPPPPADARQSSLEAAAAAAAAAARTGVSPPPMPALVCCRGPR